MLLIRHYNKLLAISIPTYLPVLVLNFVFKFIFSVVHCKFSYGVYYCSFGLYGEFLARCLSDPMFIKPTSLLMYVHISSFFTIIFLLGSTSTPSLAADKRKQRRRTAIVLQEGEGGHFKQRIMFSIILDLIR